MAVLLFRLFDGLDRVLERVKPVDPNVVQQVVHDRVQASAGMKQVRTTGRMCRGSHGPVARQNELTQVGGTDKRAAAVTQVVGPPNHFDAVEREHPPHDLLVKLNQLLTDGRHQVPLVEQRVAERLVAHQPRQELGEMGKSPAPDDAHVLGQILLEPFEVAGRQFLRDRATGMPRTRPKW